MQKLRGFTIIELLMIVVIVSVLTAIVLANLNSYRAKAKDAAIKVAIGQIAVNGSVYFEKYGNYNPAGGGDFCSDTVTDNIFSSINAPSNDKECHAGNAAQNRWRVCARLNLPATGTAQAWCADNTGTRKQITNSQCNNNSTPCP